MWWSFVARRLVSAVPTLLGVLTVVFLFVRLVPGDPAQAILGEYATPANLANMRQSLGLDKPLGEQYLTFMGKALRLDFGRSYQTRQSVAQRISDALPYTVSLGLAALFVALIVGIPAGVIASARRNSALDYGVTTAALLGISMPNFWFGMLLIIVFSVQLGWFPITGAGVTEGLAGTLYYLTLPAIALGAAEGGVIMRMTRSAMLETLSQDYVRTARAKGLTPIVVVLRHALRNSLIPVVTIVGLNLGRLIGGTVIIESLFVRPGIGRVMVDAMVARDYPQIQGTVAFFALLVVMINLLVDVSYGLLDPRIRYS
ncbi:MAG: ABC transporter permease [Trueperaceae bacterium]|nr:ABC transporter permease [Trueperaceae bacterium]MCC6310627.1 ABC transporter permease [Trueperaceae bacterium]MCW5819685.1 ABC transporter permease [Trueperaceae bacterium]